MSNKYGFAHQDLETVVIRGKGSHIKKQKERSGETTTQKKFDATHSNAMRKLDENGDTYKVDKVNPKVSRKAIIAGRTAKIGNEKTLLCEHNLLRLLLQNMKLVRPNLILVKLKRWNEHLV